MSRTQYIFVILVFLAYGIAAADELACKSEQHFDDGSSMGSDVKFTLEKDRIVSIDFNTFVSNGEEGGAYFCSFKASSSDHKSVWTYTKEKVVVRMLKDKEGPDEESNFEIAATATGYVITFTKMSRYYCGFGAEFPISLTLTKGNAACKVDYAY